MKFNSTEKIKNDGGNWLVLVDHGYEGFSVTQFATLEQAVTAVMGGHSCGSDATIAYLPDVEMTAGLRAIAPAIKGN